MPRLMAVTLTVSQVRDRSKTVTGRDGWLMLKPGDPLTLCEKVRGRKPGETLVRITDVTVEVVGCHHSDDCIDQHTRKLCSPWGLHSPCHVQVTVTAALPSPVPCPGRQKLWALPADVEQAARAQLQTHLSSEEPTAADLGEPT